MPATALGDQVKKVGHCCVSCVHRKEGGSTTSHNTHAQGHNETRCKAAELNNLLTRQTEDKFSLSSITSGSKVFKSADLPGLLQSFHKSFCTCSTTLV